MQSWLGWMVRTLIGHRARVFRAQCLRCSLFERTFWDFGCPGESGIPVILGPLLSNDNYRSTLLLRIIDLRDGQSRGCRPILFGHGGRYSGYDFGSQRRVG